MLHRQSAGNRHISTSTVQRRLRESDLHGRFTSKKPPLKDTKNKKRLAWDKRHEQWTLDRWKSVLWSGESKCNIFVFQQDNDPKHTSRLCTGYLAKKESDECCMRWSGLHNHPTLTQLRWFGLSWTAEWRKSSQQVLSMWELLQDGSKSIPH